IKVRHSAGDATLAREFIRSAQPGVYTEQVNFAAIKTALVAREKMHKRRQALEHSEQSIDVKLDRGGIRDIEFLVQCLQRVYGGKEKWLRSGGTLFSLQKLHDKQHISSKDYQALTSAYTFLRRIEHRLQLRRGQQLHRLPDGEDELRVLCASMVSRGSEPLSVEKFMEELRRHMAIVSEIYGRIIHSEQQHGHEVASSEDFALSPTLASAA